MRPPACARLWEVCQNSPTSRKLNEDEHARLVHTIFGFLMSDDGVLPDDWLARQIERLNIAEGDVATLSGRLAQIRTWTYTDASPGMDARRRPLAGRDARGGRPPVGCAA